MELIICAAQHRGGCDGCWLQARNLVARKFCQPTSYGVLLRATRFCVVIEGFLCRLSAIFSVIGSLLAIPSNSSYHRDRTLIDKCTAAKQICQTSPISDQVVSQGRYKERRPIFRNSNIRNVEISEPAKRVAIVNYAWLEVLNFEMQSHRKTSFCPHTHYNNIL